MFRGRACLGIAAIALIAAGCATPTQVAVPVAVTVADEAVIPPANQESAEPAAAGPSLLPGSRIIWVEAGGGPDTGFMNVVLHRGEDFLILFDPDMMEFADEFGAQSAYGVEFSGALYYGCDEPMPSRAARAQIAGLQQLQQGETIKLDGTATTITAGGMLTRSVGGLGPLKLREYQIDWESAFEDETRFETIMVAHDVPLTVKSAWSDGSDSIVLNVVPASSAKPLSLQHEGALGECAALMDNE